MSSTQFEEWKAFQSIDPFTPERLDALFAHLIWWIVTAMTGKAPTDRAGAEIPFMQYTLQYGVDIDPVVEVEKAIKKREVGQQNFLQSMREMMNVYGGKVVKAKS